MWRWRISGQPCAMCNLITFHCPASACMCVSAQSLSLIWLFETPWTVDHQAPLSCFCLLWRGCPGSMILNLTLSVVSWENRMWFYVWNFVQCGHWKGIPATRWMVMDAHAGWSESGWQQIRGLLGDQQCVSPRPPLHPHEETSYQPVNAPTLTLAPPTSEDRYDTGKLPATIVAASLLDHISCLPGPGPKRCWAGEEQLHLGHKPWYSG